ECAHAQARTDRMGRGEGEADRNLGDHRAGGGGRLLDAHRALTARKQPACNRSGGGAEVPPFFLSAPFALCSCHHKNKERTIGRCRSGAAEHVAAANAAVSSRRRCGREAVGVGRSFPETCVMKPTFAVCAALVGLLALSQSAIAEQKTARQCNDDWSANKASIQ